MTYPIEGYACRYHYKDDGHDILLPTILNDIPVQAGEIKMLYQHDAARPIGRWHDIENRPDGLYVKGHISQSHPDGQMVAALLQDNIIDGLSIGFITKKAYQRKDGARIIQAIDLREVSLVTFPMQKQARLNTAQKSFEHFLEYMALALSSGGAS
ncbi:MAG: HK97 family phage prohead protease [Pseudomonadota bacterium]